MSRSGNTRPCLIVLGGEAIGKVYPITETRSMVLGRATDADILLTDDGVSRKHAKLIVYTNGTVALKDLGSTNGTLVNSKRIKHQVLEDGDRIQIGEVSILKFSYSDDVEVNFRQQLYDSATRDGLTTLFNRRFYFDSLNREVAAARRHAGPLSLLLLDIDHFKAINDTQGHVAGDGLLKQLGRLLAAEVRTEDLPCRVGGEEFAIIARSTDLNGAAALAERIRAAVESRLVRNPNSPEPLTVSVGVATFDRSKHASAEALVGDADRALYRAKRAGRNQVASE